MSPPRGPTRHTPTGAPPTVSKGTERAGRPVTPATLVIRSVAARTVIVLGQYSLLGYIAQIVILQGLARAARLVDLGAGASVLALGAALLLTIVTVEATAWGRRRWSPMDRLYRAVFA